MKKFYLKNIEIKFSKILVLSLLLFSIGNVWGQSAANYAFNYGTSSLNSMTGATSLVSGNNDDWGSAVFAIGFDFYYMGVKYTHISVNSNGQARLHTSSGATALGSSNVTGYSASTVTLAPMAGDNEVNNGMSYVVSGTAPNRKLTIEWNQFYAYYTNITTSGNMQLVLNEGTGVIEYQYGNIYNSQSVANTRSIYHSSSNTANSSAYVTVAATPTVNTSATAPVTNSFAASVAIANLANVFYKFTPPTTIIGSLGTLALTSVGIGSMTLGWTDATNELGYIIERSTDNINWTTIITLAANTITYPATGLSGGTLYYWRVTPIAEGGPVTASALTGSQSTSACPTMAATISINGATATAGSSYPTLTAAINDLKICGISQPTILELSAGYTPASETYPILLDSIPGASATNTITIQQNSTLSGTVITSSNTTATIDINKGKYYIIDGRVGGSGSTKNLTISNTSTSATGTVLLRNEASNNMIKYCNLTGVGTGTTAGVVKFSTTTGSSGNDRNTIDNCDIKNGASKYLIGIYSSGSSSSLSNDNNVISNNNIYNFDGTTAFGFSATSTGNSRWTIDGNSFYQTTTITPTGSVHTAINIAGGDSNVVKNNYIGGNAATASGTWPSNATTSSNAARFIGISIAAGSTVASNIDNNTIKGFDLYTSSGGSPSTGIFTGIYVSGGYVNVGVNTGNIIGSISSNAIKVTTSNNTSTGNSYGLNGISITSTGLVNVKNNTIAGLTGVGTTASVYCKVRGVINSGGTSRKVIESNTIGSSSAPLISGVSSTTTVASDVFGIENTGAVSTLIKNNTISFLTSYSSTAVAAACIGIHATGSPDTIINNKISDLLNVSNDGPRGMRIQSTSASEFIAYNSINNLTQKGATANSVIGLLCNSAASGTTTIAYNTIQNLKQDASLSKGGGLMGMSLNTAVTFNVYNNTIVLDNGGSAITNSGQIIGIKAPTAAFNFKNNIIKINATLASPTKQVACIWNTATTTTSAPSITLFNANNNIYDLNYTASDSNFIYLQGSSISAPSMAYHTNSSGINNAAIIYDASFNNSCSKYKIWLGSSREVSSFTESQVFVGGSTIPNNLQPNPSGSSYTQNGGALLGYTTDILGAGVSTTNPDIGAIEFSAGSAIATDVIAPSITFATTLNTMCTSQYKFRARIYDAGGINTTAGTAPRVWYKKSTETDAIAATNTSADNGWKYSEGTKIGTTDTFEFTMDLTLLNSSVIATNIIQFFVVAQDSFGNVGYNSVAFTSGCPSSVSLSGITFPTLALPTIKSFTISTSINPTLSLSPSNICGSGNAYIVANALGTDQMLTRIWEYKPASSSSWTTYTPKTANLDTTSVLTSTDNGYQVRTSVSCPNNLPVIDMDTVTAYITATPTLSSTTPATRCGAGTVALSATPTNSTDSVLWYSASAGGSLLYTGQNFTTPSISSTTDYYVSEAIVGSPTTVTIGNGTSLTGSTSNPTAFMNWLSGYRSQTIFTASELNAQGITAGNITSIGFNINTPGASTSNSNYTIMLGTTALTQAPTTFVTTGFSTVYGPATYTHTNSGLQTITFTTPYLWDGISNIIMDITMSGANSSSNATTYYTTTTNSMTSTATSTTATTGTTTTIRLNTTFGYTPFCIGSRTTVTATVNTPPSITASATTSTICTGVSDTLNVSSSNSGYTYSWSNSAGSGTSVYVTPSSSTTYTVTATDNSGGANNGCVITATVPVTVNPAPTVMTLSQGRILSNCYGMVDSLMASGGLVSSNATLGTGTTVNTANALASTDYPAPYGNYYENTKQQYLIRASELTAMGLTNGSEITSLAFDVTTLGTSGVHKAYTISIGNTTQTDISTWESGLSTVFGPIDYQPVSGSNVHSFSSSFVWNGTSNIVVQVCHTNDASNSGTFFTVNAISKYSTTTFNSSLTYKVDNTSACATSSLITYTEMERPNMIFTVKNQNVTWSPTTGLFTNLACTTPYSGSSASKVYSKPTSTTTYTATATIGSCSVIASIIDSVKSSASNLILAGATTSGAIAQCQDPSSSWVYYAGSSTPDQWIFAVDTSACTGMSGATITVNVDPMTVKTSSNGTNQEHAMYLMGRSWDVTTSAPISGTAKVRFFYDPADSAATVDARDAAYNTLKNTTNSATLAVKSAGLEWFKSVGVPYDATFTSGIVGNRFPSAVFKGMAPTYGVINNIHYVELSNITSFSGGTGGASFGPVGGSGNSLPVTWAEFNVTPLELSNELVWKTASEKNTSHFEVEYSYDGSNFVTTGERVKAAGNSSGLLTYKYSHSDLSTHIYYRILQVDLDNKNSYSDIKLLKRATLNNTMNVKLFPIPLGNAKDLNVSITTADKAPIKYTITDFTGRVISTETKSIDKNLLNFTIPTEGLSSGLYTIEFTNGFETVTRRISK